MIFFTSLLLIFGLIVLFLFLLGASLLSGFFRLLFGSKKGSSFGGESPFGKGTPYNKQGQQAQSRQSSQSSQEATSSHHKVFSEDEGDYVEFEEVDEN